MKHKGGKKTGERILSAAKSLFERQGLNKTTIDDIAQAVDMKKSSLYYYFPSKEGIFRAVLLMEVDGFRAQVEKIPTTEAAPGKMLRSYIVSRMDFLKDMANAYTAFREEYRTNYAFIEEIRQEIDRFEVETVEKILRLGIDRNEFAVDDPHLTALTIVTAAKGLEYDWSLHSTREQIARNTDTLLQVLFFGICKKESE